MNRIVTLAVATALAAGLPLAPSEAATAPAPPVPVAPTCPPLDVYSIVGVNLPHTTLTHAAETLFSGTGWKVHVAPGGEQVPVALHDVSGPLDQVLASLVAQTTGPAHTVTDLVRRDQCVVTLSVASAAPPQAPAGSGLVPASAHGLHPVPGMPVSAEALQQQAMAGRGAQTFGTNNGVAHAAAEGRPVKSAPKAYTLPQGQLLSRALTAYVASKHWSLKWRITDADFMLTAPLPIPAGDNVIQGVTYVLHAYQALGALVNVVPLFSTANYVAALLPASALTESERRQLGTPASSATEPSKP